MNTKQFGLVVAAAVVAGFLGGLAGSRLVIGPTVLAQGGRGRVIEAEEFRLVERDGKPCGRFQVDKEGRPGLTLYDKHGEVRAVLGVLPSGSPHLALSDRRGRVRAALAVWSDERVALILSDGEGTPRMHLAAPADGGPSLGLSDRGGKTRAVLGAAPVELVRVPTEAALSLFDGVGKVIWVAP